MIIGESELDAGAGEALQAGPRISHPSLNGLALRGVNLGGWLITERWLKPSLWDRIPDSDLIDGAEVQFRCTANGEYIAAEGGGGGAVIANTASPSGDDIFRLWRLGDRRFHFRTPNDQFLKAVGGGGGQVWATSLAAGAWETFRVVINPYLPEHVYRIQIRTINGSWIVAKDGRLTAELWEDPGWGDGPGVFEMTPSPKMQGDYQLCNGLGPELAKEVLQQHWDEFVTEADFRFMSEHGINAVRIPIGWWLTREGDVPAPYVEGGAGFLDRVFDWAHQHGIVVLVDLHAAPGSQNGWDHGGSRDGTLAWGRPGTDFIEQTLGCIEWLAKRYGPHPALLGIQVLNEPRYLVDIAIIKDFYVRAYDAVRAHAPAAYVCVSCRVDANPSEWCGFMGDAAAFRRVIMDVGHWYAAWLKPNQIPAYYTSFIYATFLQRLIKLAQANPNVPLILGEWSMDMKGAAPPPGEFDLLTFGHGQVTSWAQATGGWFFFNLKVEGLGPEMDGWSFRRVMERGWLDPASFQLNPPLWELFPPA